MAFCNASITCKTNHCFSQKKGILLSKMCEYNDLSPPPPRFDIFLFLSLVENSTIGPFSSHEASKHDPGTFQTQHGNPNTNHTFPKVLPQLQCWKTTSCRRRTKMKQQRETNSQMHLVVGVYFIIEQHCDIRDIPVLRLKLFRQGGCFVAFPCEHLSRVSHCGNEHLLGPFS